MRNIKFKIDIEKQNYVKRECMQNDDIVLNITLFENGIPYNIGTNKVTLNWVKNDNTFVLINTTKEINITNNVVNIMLPRDCTRATGEANFELSIIDINNKQVSTFPLCIDVVSSVITSNTVLSGNIVTATEELNASIAIGNTLDGVLKEDTVTATPLQASLHQDIVDANKFKDQLNIDIADGKVLQPILQKTVDDATSINTTLNTSNANAQSSINLIRSAGNPHFDILTTDWVTNTDTSVSATYMKDITHALETESIQVTSENIDTKMSVFNNYKTVDVNTKRFFTDTLINLRVILSARYYDGGSDIGDEVKLARGSKSNLKTRLDGVDEQLAESMKHQSDMLNVKSFGVKGDGTTDDTITIQSAFDYCSENKLMLYFPKGVYIINSPILLYANRLYNIIGCNPYNSQYTNEQSCIIKFNGTMFDSSTGLSVNINSMQISELAFTPNVSSNTTRLFSTNIVLKGSHIYNCYILSIGTIFNSLQYVSTIENNMILGICKSFCDGDISDSTISNNYINGQLNTYVPSFIIGTISSSRIINNYIDFFKYIFSSARASGVNTAGEKSIIITGNVFDYIYRITNNNLVAMQFIDNVFVHFSASNKAQFLTNNDTDMQNNEWGILVNPYSVLYSSFINNQISNCDVHCRLYGATCEANGFIWRNNTYKGIPTITNPNTSNGIYSYYPYGVPLNAYEGIFIDVLEGINFTTLPTNYINGSSRLSFYNKQTIYYNNKLLRNANGTWRDLMGDAVTS